MPTIFLPTKIFKSFVYIVIFGEWLKFLPIFNTADFFYTD